MDRDARDLLGSLGLRQPRLIPLQDELDEADVPERVYLRAASPVHSPGLMHRSQFLDFVRSVDLTGYEAVEFVPSIGGAVCVTTAHQTYLELVDGHLTGLLQAGILRERVLLDGRSGTAHSRPCPSQANLIDPETLELKVASSASARLREPLLVAAGVQAELARVCAPANVMFEVMITPRGLVWADAKAYPWQLDFEPLFTGRRCTMYRTQRDTHPYEPPAWVPACVLEDPASVELRIGERPLLAHFVTYSLERGLGAILSQ